MSTEDNNIVERELFRKRIYENKLLKWLTSTLVSLKPDIKKKEIQHIALRYVFNKIITREPDDDPVFIVTKSNIAEKQLEKDLEYNGITGKTQKFINEIENIILTSSNEVKSTILKKDFKCVYIKTKIDEVKVKSEDVQLNEGKIRYGYQTYDDISNLGKNNPTKLNYAVALNIRYNYLKLLNHGLARTFEKDGFSPKDASEGFASAFNHYFDSFCSAFPDLERPFGSMGSFFEVIRKTMITKDLSIDWKTNIVFINPPFDDSLMACAMERVYEYLRENDRKFIFTIPNWENYPSLDKLKKSEFTKSVQVHKKGDLPFIDYMNNKRVIYPCDIAEVVLSK